MAVVRNMLRALKQRAGIAAKGADAFSPSLGAPQAAGHRSTEAIGGGNAIRELALVLVVALLGVLLAAAVVLSPWHPAEATQTPITGFVTRSPGQS